MLKQGYALIAENKFPPRSLVKFCCRYMSPCQMTILGLFFGCLAGVSIPFFLPVVPLAIVLVSIMCDFLDGAMVRWRVIQGKRANWGLHWIKHPMRLLS